MPFPHYSRFKRSCRVHMCVVCVGELEMMKKKEIKNQMKLIGKLISVYVVHTQ